MKDLGRKAREISDERIVEELFNLKVPCNSVKEHISNLGPFGSLYKSRLKKGIAFAKENGLSFYKALDKINEYVFSL